MDFKRILRGPLLYIVIAVIVVWVGSSLLTGSGYTQVSTQQGLKYLQDGQVTSAKIIDGDQPRVDLTLKTVDKGTKQKQFYYVAARGPEVVKAVTAQAAQYDD
jgi:cell division protease FtsH